MKVIIAGSRDIVGIPLSPIIAASGFHITEVVSGRARGIDRTGEVWAALNKKPIRYFPADWETHGKSAGYRRNAEMASYADALIAVWDGQSRGTQNMMAQMKLQGKPVHVHLIPR